MTRNLEILQAAQMCARNYGGENLVELAFKKGAEWADAHQPSPWISVDDRLPGEDGKTKTSKVVFIRTDRGLSTSAWYNFETEKWHLLIGFSSGDDDVIDDTITNWMPIPELKGGEE